MNHFVPEFDMDVDYSIPSSSGHHRQDDEILELLWQNGQVVVQSQNSRLHRKPSPPPTKFLHHHQQQQEQQKHHPPPSQLAAASPPLPTPPDCDSNTQLFMQEDEMNSWLEYPYFDRDLADLLYIPPGQPPSSSVALRPPPPPPLPPVSQPQHHRQTQAFPVPPRPEAPATDVNFPQFSKTTTTRFLDSGPSTSSRNNEMRESTVVDSSDTPAIRQKPKILLAARNAVEISGSGNRCREGFGGGRGCEIGAASTAGGASMSMSREIDTCDLTQTSSPGGSGASLSLSATATADLMTLQPADDRKRKGREPADEVNAEYQSEYVEIESCDPKKQPRGAANKKSRAAEVHNLSERRRRDRINEKMKVLQELIPRSSKMDKASMLDEAIDYLKSLQMQVQMMSMGCGMVPVMFPGVQQYMGMGMGMGMGMEMGMTRPVMPFPGVLSGSALPTPGAPSHLNPRFPLQAFPTPGDASVNPGHNMAMIPSLADAYQQCMSMQQMPVPIPQNQLTRQPSISKQSANRGGEVHENPPTG